MTRDSSTGPQNNRQSLSNHRQNQSTRSSFENRCFLTINIEFFFSQQRHKYLICLQTNQADPQKKFQLDPYHRWPWSCRPRSHETNQGNSTPSLRWPALPFSLLITEKLQAPSTFGHPENEEFSRHYIRVNCRFVLLLDVVPCNSDG